MDYLSSEGVLILNRLKKHVSGLKTMDIDSLEMTMLANSFDLYAKAAKLCNEDGVSMTIITEKGGEYSQIRPEYTVMKTEYMNILKHGVKFGLNPADRDKIFKDLKEEKKKGFDLTVSRKQA